MKFFNTLALAAVSALALAATPALAQTAGTTTTPTTTTCTTGCPQSITIAGMAQFGGIVQGGFGTVDSAGNLVSSPNVTGTVDSAKKGTGAVNVSWSGCITPTCGTATSSVNASEVGHVNVTGATNTSGTMLTLANSGSLVAVVGLAQTYNPGSTTTTTAPAH